MNTYQLLPPLSSDDYARLEASILESGVLVPILKNDLGEILDGHHRDEIARKHGLPCPVEIRTGLPPHEQRLLAATLNVARRHLTDGQKALIGLEIEPDIAERARQRKAHGLTAPGRTVVDRCPEALPVPISTRDEVARTVGLGSGRSFERAKQVVESLKAEPDGEQLVSHLQSGDWDLDDAREELKTRQKVTATEQARAEQATSNRLLSIVGDPNGRIERAQLRAAFSAAQSSTSSKLLLLKPEALVDVIDSDNERSVRRFIADCRQWLDELESNLGRGIRLVSRKDA